MDRGSTNDRNRRWKRIAALLVLGAAAVCAPVVQAADDALTLGVFPRRNSAETAKLFTPLAGYLGERLGRKVTLITSRNFEAFSKELAEERFDIVHYNQYQYIRSTRTYKVIAHTQE